MSSSSPTGSKLRASVRADRRQRVELAAQVVEQRPAVVGEDGLEPGGRVEGVGELEELARVEPASAGRPLDRRADVVGRADADAGPLLTGARGPGPSRRGRARRGPGRSRGPASRRGGATAGTRSARPAARGRAGTPGGRSSACPSWSAGGPAAARPTALARDRRAATAAPSTARRRTRSRPAARSRRSVPARGRRRLQPERRADRAGRAGQRPVEVESARRRARARSRDGIGYGDRARSASGDAPWRPAPRDRAGAGPRRMGQRRRAARRRGRAARRACPAVSVDDVQAVVHPVDKVHVGPARRPVHDRVPGGRAEAGVGGPVVLADVGLDLDDPGHPPAGARRRGPGAPRAARPASSVGRQDRPSGQGRGRFPRPFARRRSAGS